MLGAKAQIILLKIAAVNQNHNAVILLTANNPARRLEHLLHTGVLVGVSKAIAQVSPQAFTQGFLLYSDHGQAYPYNHGAD